MPESSHAPSPGTLHAAVFLGLGWPDTVVPLNPSLVRGRLVALISALPLMFPLWSAWQRSSLFHPTHFSSPLKHSLRDRVVATTSSLTASLAINSNPLYFVGGGRSCLSSHAPRWSQDPFLSGRGARHLNLPLLCPLCEAPSDDLSHCLSEYPAFSDLRESTRIPFHSGFAILVHAHVAFVGQVCERCVSL